MTLKKKQASIRPHDQVRKTTCLNCPAGCGLKVFVRQGRVVDLFGDEEHPTNKGSVCPKGLLSLYHLYNPKRLTAARIRPDLQTPFKEVSWEEALDFLSDRLHEVAERHGKGSVFVQGGEIDPFGYLAGGSWFAGHYGAGGGPGRVLPPMLGNKTGLELMFGVPEHQLQMNSPRDWCASGSILLFRSNLAATDPMTLGPLLDARDRGSCLVAVDSTRTVTLSRATLPLRVKPGSEAILLKGLIHLLFAERRVEWDFLQSWTEGAEKLRERVRSFTPERVSRECGFKSSELRQAAELIGTRRPLQVIAGDWYSRRFLSEEELRLCGALETLRGSIGMAGGGLNLMAVSPFSWGRRIEEDRALIAVNSKQRAKAIFCYGNSLIRSSGGQEPQEQLDLVVHLGAYPDGTFHRAHVFLPMSFWLEHEGLAVASNARVVQWHNKVVEPPGSCRSPLQFWTDLADRCDLGEKVPWRGDLCGVDHRAAADLLLKQCPLTQAIRTELLDPERNPSGGILWPCTEERQIAYEDTRLIKGNVRGINILFQYGRRYPFSEQRFPTASGKINLTAVEESSAPASPGDDPVLYPLLLTTGVLVDYVQEFGFFVSDRPQAAVSPFIKIHPQIGALLGIAPGDQVTIENQHGEVTGPAWLTDEVAPGVLWCPEGVEHFQPAFCARSPRSLFAAPRPDGSESSWTRVMLRRKEADREQNRLKLVKFLQAASDVDQRGHLFSPTHGLEKTDHEDHPS